MHVRTAEELARRMGGELNAEPNLLITGFSLDNREVQVGNAFLAIRGARSDGHQFVANALERGASLAVVEEPVSVPHILVANLVDALARMARSIREEFLGPVVAVTGSAGKTSSKEFLAAALAPLGPVLKSQGNRNSEFTSPLVWAELRENHRVAIIEMAMRGFGQIAHLASFSRPNVALITNIGIAHVEMVGSREGIAQAKGEVLEALPSDGLAILWHEDDYLEVLRTKSPRAVTFGFSDGADCQISSYQPTSWTSAEIRGTVFGQSWTAEIPAVGRHMALNAAAVVLTAQTLSIDPQLAADQLRHAALPPMRMEVIEVGGFTVILDAYNASPPSVLLALQTLIEIPTTGRRRVVIGEMRELGAEGKEAHFAIGSALAELNILDVIYVGEPLLGDAMAAGMSGVTLRRATTLDDVTAFLRETQPGDTVLVKGSRLLELERAVDALKEST